MKEFLIFNIIYKWKYLLAILKSRLIKVDKKSTIDSLVYVAREADKNWIFGTKVRRLSEHSGLNASAYFHAKLRDLPEADGYYFIYPHYFCRAMRHNPQILRKKNIVMFTHAHYTTSYSKTHIAWCLNLADKVICLNSQVKEDLIGIGIKPEKLEVIHIASDPEFFYSHERKNGDVGFCSNFGERKNPELVFQIIKNMPQKHFHIFGKNWENFDKFPQLEKLKNFTYHNNRDYSEFPELYSKIDTFVSPSILEGGPVPILESMLSNCVPVASKTGFCPDIIKHGENGFLFDIDASYKDVIPLIEDADTIKIDIRETALEYSWENCAKKIDQLFLDM